MQSGSGKTRKKLPNLNGKYLMNLGTYSTGNHFWITALQESDLRNTTSVCELFKKQIILISGKKRQKIGWLKKNSLNKQLT